MTKSTHSVLRPLLNFYDLLRSLARAMRNRRIRWEMLTRVRYGSNHFQGSTFTLPDRYPVLFEQCRIVFGAESSPRILSFGCSTGEEVFSLARKLPAAHIIGVEINPWALDECRRKNNNPNLTFLHSLDDAFHRAGDFDAIFCLAVFQRTENRTSMEEYLESGFLFEHFERGIALLDRKLKVGGLLFLDHCDFSFLDTSTASRYTPHLFPSAERLRKRLLFGQDNRLKQTEYVVPRAFRKVRD